MSDTRFKIEFVPSGRGKAQCPPDPTYPNGVDINLCSNPRQPACVVTLPYPAPECGLFVVECNLCHMRIGATAAGRPDDPKSLTIPCQFSAAGQA